VKGPLLMKRMIIKGKGMNRNREIPSRIINWLPTIYREKRR
jgi:hypothetical protein